VVASRAAPPVSLQLSQVQRIGASSIQRAPVRASEARRVPRPSNPPAPAPRTKPPARHKDDTFLPLLILDFTCHTWNCRARAPVETYQPHGSYYWLGAALCPAVTVIKNCIHCLLLGLTHERVLCMFRHGWQYNSVTSGVESGWHR
jgi:hypothetical protein